MRPRTPLPSEGPQAGMFRRAGEVGRGRGRRSPSVIGRRRLKGMDGACVLAVALHRRHQQGPGRETPAERGRERECTGLRIEAVSELP